MTAPQKTLRRLALVACLVVLAVAAAGAPAASAKSSASKAAPCWKKLITDWYDGRIDHSYPVHCYRDALKHLPQDVRTYSDAYDVISRALASATRGKKHVDQNALIAPPVGPGNGGSGGTGGGGKGPGGGDAGGGSGSGVDSGFLNQAVGKLGSNKADTVPVPLLVLAGLAVLLVAAGGAGLLARRVQARRARP
ncbi:MAG TPA: hypothetical protein VLN26_10275 [Gaiellaceae bacterium]|nr:hypothetical protein [Gaiellaceae bacterium]